MVRGFAARAGFCLACNVGAVRAAWSAAAPGRNCGGNEPCRITVQVLLSELEGYDLLGVAQGAISYAYPFTARRTAHRVTLHSQMLHALCAIDALGVGAMYGADAVIESSCRTCGAAISIETTQHGLALGPRQPGDSVVWYDLTYDCSAANSCCPSIAFFCSDEHLEQWIAAQTTRPVGQRLALTDAFENGRALFGPVLKPALPARGDRAGRWRA